MINGTGVVVEVLILKNHQVQQMINGTRVVVEVLILKNHQFQQQPLEKYLKKMEVA